MVAHNPLTPCGCAHVRPALLLAALLLMTGCLDAGPGTLEDVESAVPEGVIEGDPAQFGLLGSQPSGTTISTSSSVPGPASRQPAMSRRAASNRAGRTQAQPHGVKGLCATIPI